MLILTLAVGCGKKDPVEPEAMTFEEFVASVDGNKVVAELEGTTLTYNELFELLEAHNILEEGAAEVTVSNNEMLTEYASQIVMRKKIYEDAQTAGFVADDEAINVEMLMVEMQFPDLTEAELDKVRNFLAFFNTISEYLNELVTEEEAREFYSENEEQFVKVSVRHILIKADQRTDEEALALANELTNRIRQGEDMAALATEHTEDPGSADNGGLYEDAVVVNWVEEFKEAALNFELNVVGDPVKTVHGYHVIRVENRSVTPFDQIIDMIKDSLASGKFWEYMDELEGKVKVTL